MCLSRVCEKLKMSAQSHKGRDLTAKLLTTRESSKACYQSSVVELDVECSFRNQPVDLSREQFLTLHVKMNEIFVNSVALRYRRLPQLRLRVGRTSDQEKRKKVHGTIL